MKTILIVDDDNANRYILQTLLETNGMRVVTACDGQEALYCALAEPPDLILSDILMPVMDGYALCKHWKEEDRLTNIPFIFYTATYTDPKDEDFALKLGATRFIIKPQEPHVILAIIKNYLEKPSSTPASANLPLGSEMEFFHRHNAILFSKLEKKMVDLEQANQQLIHEVEERKKAEEKLLKITQAIEESPVAIILTDLEGRIEYGNPKFFEISGYDPVEILGKNASLLRSDQMPDDIYKELLRSVMARNIWRGELCNQRKDGNLFWSYLTTSPIRNARGDIVNYMAIMEDISERRKLEEQLRQVQKLDGIGQLAGGVAHDFNNILTTIIGYAYIVYLNMQKDDPLRSHIKNVLDFAEKAASITKSLLAFSSKQSTRPAREDVNRLISNFQQFLRRFLPESIEIRTKCLGKPLPVLVDSVQIEQVIMNLATNARDAMPRGGLFEIKTGLMVIDEQFVLSNGYGKPGDFAEILVSDTGCGMDRLTREKIFEPFFTTKEQGKGTGLGLAIVYGIVQKHNGYILVSSEPDRGAVFRILLPLVQGISQGDKKKIEPASRGGSEVILIAEDDPGIRELISTILSDHGYQVISASDGKEALQKYTSGQERIALVMLDGSMPKKSGVDVYRTIRGTSASVNVLFLSGYSENMIELDDIQDDHVHFLQKPALPSSILRKVRDILDQAGKGV